MKSYTKALIAAAGAAAGIYTAGAGVFLYASSRKRLTRGGAKEQNYISTMKPYREQINRGMHWFAAQPREKVKIKGRDGASLYGYWLDNPRPRGIILLIHGYRSSIKDFSCAFKLYYDLGFSILAITQRGTGESGGRYISFGALERFDCLDWARYIAARKPSLPILIGGISMGATTALLASALGLPENVRGIVADCGFTSAREEMKYVCEGAAKFLPDAAFDLVELAAQTIGGFSYKIDTRIALRLNRLPVLFIHGEDDTYVPPRFTRENYAECRAYKRLVMVPGAEHGMSFLVDTPRCSAAIREFVDYCLEGKLEAPTI